MDDFIYYNNEQYWFLSLSEDNKFICIDFTPFYNTAMMMSHRIRTLQVKQCRLTLFQNTAI